MLKDIFIGMELSILRLLYLLGLFMVDFVFGKFIKDIILELKESSLI
jgi:hypothetical protein